MQNIVNITDSLANIQIALLFTCNFQVLLRDWTFEVLEHSRCQEQFCYIGEYEFGYVFTATKKSCHVGTLTAEQMTFPLSL